MARSAEKRCPECGRAASDDHFPFCSVRCRQIDLGRWLKGDYAIPGEPVDPADLPPSRDPADD